MLFSMAQNSAKWLISNQNAYFEASKKTNNYFLFAKTECFSLRTMASNILNKNIAFTNLPFQENVVQTRSQTEKSQISSKL